MNKKIIPTKINLIRLRKTLSAAKKVHSILEDRRDVLLYEINRMIEKANNLQENLLKLLKIIYQKIDLAESEMGDQLLEIISLSSKNILEIGSEHDQVAGIKVLKIKVDKMIIKPIHSLFETSSLDDAMTMMTEAFNIIIELANVENIIYRLANDLERIQKQINMLKYIYIPSLEKNIIYIKNTLEEREREEFVRLKFFKTIILGKR